MLKAPKQARKAFKTEMTASVFVGVLAGAVGPFVPFIASHRLHASATLISLIVAAPWAGGALCFMWARAMEGRSAMRFATKAWVTSRGSLLLMFLATNPYTFALVSMFHHFSATIAYPGYTAIMKAVYPDDHRGRLMSYCRLTTYIVATASTLAVGPILKSSGSAYRTVFPIAAIFGVISALIFSRIHVPGDKESCGETERATIMDSFRRTADILRHDKRFAWFILTTSIYGFGNFLAMPVYPKFMDDVLRMNEGNLAIYAGLASMTPIVSYPYWGHCIDMKSPVRATKLAILINAGLPLVFLMAPTMVAIFPNQPTYLWVLPAAVITGLMVSGLELAYFNTAISFAPPGREVAYQSVQYGVQGLRGIVGPLLGGIMYDALRRGGGDVRYIFLISFVIIMIGWTMLIRGRRV